MRWVYLDIGKFHGLAETIDEVDPLSDPDARRTATRRRPASSPARPAIRSTCCTRRTPYPLPVSLAIGDKVLIEAAGAYTATYSSVGFNGYPPLRQYVI